MTIMVTFLTAAQTNLHYSNSLRESPLATTFTSSSSNQQNLIGDFSIKTNRIACALH
jgi:hypothetical protein